MKHNDYECRQCGAHFNSKAELQRHNHEQHSMHGRSAPASSSSSSPEGQSSQGTDSSMGRPSSEDNR